jgi:hypothetical protein
MAALGAGIHAFVGSQGKSSMAGLRSADRHFQIARKNGDCPIGTGFDGQ